MADMRTPLYLARASYRQRRLIDGKRLLPVLLFALFLLPLLWGGGTSGAPLGKGVNALVHVFVFWGLGIAATFAFARALRQPDPDARTDGEGKVAETTSTAEDDPKAAPTARVPENTAVRSDEDPAPNSAPKQGGDH